ncbi:hypothetical protein Val02_35120 [Virgisporangium aliadipatigenens]|uniref:PIN domain-containing protein n=1 Tax=Virgisporangium aliadipatigenens TaxID=741659 RepID=A0A8J3YML9_9ACTN|nr:hypothetical protein [Virgisporangium aliadipatigenens]GIJ46626.1 hypothetical protein Val02_35120 [Virgisporangium aliadipatigenens]
MIHLILDASAVAAYGTGVDVGETIAEVAHNGAAFTSPAVCLAEAGRSVDHRLIDLLIDHRAFAACELPVEKWPVLSAALGLLARHDHAAAVTAAIVLDGHILTAEPEAYSAFGDEAPIIPL